MADNTIDILLNARMNVSDAVGGVSEIQKAMRGLTLPKGISADLEKSFSKLTPLLKDYQKQLNKGFSSQKDIKNFNLLKEKIDSVFGDIKSQIKEVNGQEIRLKANTQEIDAVKNKIVKAQADLNNALQNVFKKNQSAASIETAFGKLENAIPKNWTKVTDMMSKASGSFKAGNYAEFNRQLQNTLNYIQKLSNVSQVDLAHRLGMDKAKTDITEAQKYFNNFFNSLKTNIKEANNIESLRTKLSELGVELEGLNIKSLEDGPKAFEEWVQSIMNVDGALDQLHGSTQDTAKGMVRMVDEVNELKSSTQYFFSLRNMINLLKRGIDEAVQSVKDLDKAMTETAVVTDFSVADMWKDLPKYTQIANELGATTQGAYETMTLYYQQGLDQQQAFALGAETMKMARIAGLDYAETTDMMTAALRGFNMELNEVSAKRVNDVYSELAAITASDTEELGTAMQRTASIAASAGASFEGTTAFLAQAIETTREPAENIGTAMKTIVARFQEMKKNPLEISEVDGEEVDYNKIDAALKTIGVDLKDTNGQFREFDQVMLDISARWDGLSQAQQRYIATTAAGSRQQSRFIAMVSNYDRTMQLMEAANNSAGASDEQFGKTMDSLEAKLNKLHNAWQQFTMGIMNNNMVKGIVDAGTSILTIVNKIIDVLSFNGQSGLIKSLLSLTTAFTALKGGGKIINSLIGGLGGLVDPQSSFKEGLKGGFLGGRSQLQADRISNPIVKAINGLIPYISKVKVNEKGAYVSNKPGSYEAARAKLNQQLGGIGGFGFGKGNGKYSIDNIRTIINDNQLDKEQQKNFFQASPGFKKNITNSLSSLMQQVGTEPQIIQSLAKGFKQGDLTLDEVLLQGGLATTAGEKIKAEMSKAGKEGGKAAAIKTGKEYIKTLRQQGIQKGLKGKELKDFVRNSIIPTEEAKKGLSAEQELSVTEKMGNALGKAGAGLMQLGSGLQTIGANISTINPQLGQMVTNFGNMLTTAGSAMTALQALSNPLVLAGAAIGTVIALEQARISKIKTSAEEITESFKETNKTTQENIASLKSYQSELATLSKGVDINGNNVSLSGAEYERYLEIIDEIATLNPSIVQGYNAQGHAIINNNKALDETIAKQEELQKKSLNDYIHPDSLQKLIDARNINGTFRGVTSKVVEDKKASKWQEDQGLAGTTKVQTAPMTVATQKVLAEMQKQKGLDIDSILQGYGISLEQLQTGEEKAVNTFVKNQDQINAQVGAAIATSGEEISESLTESFDKLSEQTANFDAAIAPVLQNLQTYVSNTPAFKNVAPEFQNALMSGLKDIVIQPDLDAKGMQEQARVLVQEFDNLSAEGSDYANAMKEVEAAQDQFAASLDASEYTKNTENALQTLDSLMSHYAGKTDAYSQAIAEYLQTQMDQIRDFTTDSGTYLSQAFNGVSDTLAAAEGAYSSFQESTKTDLATGKDSMKSIFDEITKETDGVALHMERFGDGTMWKGARALLGDKFVEENADNVDKIKKAIKSLGPELEAGEKGFAAFWNNFSQVDDSKIKGFKWNEDGSYDIDRDVNPEVYEQIADAMHRSEEYVVAMLNAGKQFADIDFHNVNDVRKALATDNATIKSGDKIFVKSDYYENALDEANIFNPNERKNIKAQDKAAGIIEIKNPDQITKKDFKSMGITDLASLIKTFGDTGQYNRDEISQYAEALGKSGLIDYRPEDFAAGYQNYLDSQEHPEMQPIQSIDSTVQQIANLIAADQIRKGNISENDKQAAKDFYDSIIGGKGNDTLTQQFGEGKNEFGNDLTAKQYAENREQLRQAKLFAEEQVKLYEQGAKAAEAHGDDETAEELRAAGKQYADALKSINANLTEGDLAWKNKYAQQKSNEAYQKALDSGMSAAMATKEAESVKQEALAKAQEITKALEEGSFDGLDTLDSTEVRKKANDLTEKLAKTGIFGNTDITNRPTIEWGAKPSKLGSKWDAAASYGWTEDQLRNSVSTYMSSADTFKTVNGGEISLTFTPIMENGEVIDATTMHNYLESLINEATNQSTGELDISKLMKLDQTGLKQFTTETGEQIHNVLMGAFEGEDADLMSGALGALEHYMEEGNMETASQAAKLIQDAVEGAEGAKEELAALIDSANQFHESSPTYTPGKEAYTDTNTKGGTNVTEFKSEGADEVKKDEKDIKDAADKGAEHKTKFTTEGEAQVQQRLNNMEKKGSTSVKVDSDTSSATSGISNVIANVAKTTAKIPVGITDNASSPAKTIAKGIDALKATIDISPNYTGTWRKDIYFGATGPGANKAATGVNNKISSIHVPMLGSVAKGTKKGRVGPRNQGGPTLTGEEGYEIAWLPDENRSTILGVGGPQMVNLPKNAVVYNHEQSKEIIKKRKGISAGSMDRGSYTPSTSISGDSSSNNTYVKNLVNNAKKTGDSVAKNVENTTKAIARVTVWWENAARRAEAIQRKTDANQDEYTKYLKDIRATLTSTGEAGGNKFIENQQAYIKEQERQYQKAATELNQMDTGKNSKNKTVKATKKNYGKGADNVLQVSYKTKKGKNKTSYINTKKYITVDPETGAYQIDQSQLKKIKNKEKRKNVADALNKELNDRISKQNAAEDNIKKAQEALEKFSEELYDNFFGWEIELTKIQNITQQIEALTNKISRKDAMKNLINAQIKAGTERGGISAETGAKQLLTNFNNTLELQQKELVKRREAIDQSQMDLFKKASGGDIAAILASVTEKLAGDLSETDRAGYEKYKEELESQQEVITAALTYTNINPNKDGTYTIDFDTETFEKDKLDGKIVGDMGKEIQDFVKSLEESSAELDRLYQTQYQGLAELYNTLDDLDNQWAGYESQLIEINEEANKKELEQVKKLSDSVKKSMDDLLNDVKRKLDERRKQEDNLKTEQDISQKQQRLVMLRANTSGGNQVEIARLQKEIAEAQTNYQRSLEDQLLERMQNQAEEAARQRERQIELQEELVNGVNNIAEVQLWMSNPEYYKDSIQEQFRQNAGYYETGAANQTEIDKRFDEFFSGLLSNRDMTNEITEAIKSIPIQTEINTDKKIEGVTVPKTTTLNSSNKSTGEQHTEAVGLTNAQKELENAKKTVQYKENQINSFENQIATTEQTIGSLISQKSRAKDSKAAANLQKQIEKHQAQITSYRNTITTLQNDIKRLKDKYKFKKGGLASSTGPAWLDGTPSKPELVLNAKDTQNFITLKDVLAKVMDGTGDISNTYSDILYEININVDKIEKDYDVDRVIEKVKKEITKCAGYRNVTQVRNFR